MIGMVLGLVGRGELRCLRVEQRVLTKLVELMASSWFGEPLGELSVMLSVSQRLMRLASWRVTAM